MQLSSIFEKKIVNVPSLSTIQSYYLVIRWRRNRDAKYRRRTDIGKEQIDVKIICGKCKNDRNVKESNAIFNTLRCLTL